MRLPPRNKIGLRLLLCIALVSAATAALNVRPLAHESPIDHVDRQIRLWVEGDRLFIRYQLQLSQRAAMMQLQKMDVDKDGTVSPQERDAQLNAYAVKLSRQLELYVADKAVEVSSAGPVKVLPHCRQVYVFSGQIGTLTSGTLRGKLVDNYSRHYPGSYRGENPKHDSGARAAVKVLLTDIPQLNSGHAGALVLNFDLIAP